MTHRSLWLACVALSVRTTTVRAQPPTAIDVEAAMAIARAHHPITEEDTATVRARTAAVDVERARYWPDVRLFGELDRSTSNTVSGALFSVPSLPVVTGSAGRTWSSNFVTAVGATASWDAIGFARWDALIDQAKREVRVARQDAAARDLEIEFTAADRLIAVVASDEAVKAARSGVDRVQVFVPIVKAAVSSNLRPGADLSRAEAELAIAKTALIHAEAAAQVARARLATALGMPGSAFDVRPGGLLRLPPAPPAIASSPTDPRLAAQDARIEASKARRRVIETGTLPRLDLVGAIWGRGGPNDTGGAQGIVPDVPNWAVGVVVTWPVFAGATVAPQTRVEDAVIARDRAREREIRDDIVGSVAEARAILDGAYRTAENTPVALKAARDAEQQATARYKAQLTTADDVAQAQRLLEQAEIDDAVARLEVWRAILLGAFASGDLDRFTKLYHQAGG